MGRDDPLVPPVDGRILARLIPDARLRMIDGGHLFMVTRPIETARTTPPRHASPFQGITKP